MASNVTVDGRPLEQVIAEQRAQEIEESKPRIKLPRQVISRHNGNHSDARTSPGEVIWTQGQKATHVRFCGSTFPWLAKAPFVTSGRSILGGVELCEPSGEIKCHECGEWMLSISTHLRSHRISAREYRMRHGISMKRSLLGSIASGKLRDKLKSRFLSGSIISGNPPHNVESNVKRAKTKEERVVVSYKGVNPETLNFRNHCIAQRFDQLRSLAVTLGRTPTKTELYKYTANDGTHPLQPNSLTSLCGTSITQIMKIAGLKPNKRGCNKLVKSYVA